MTARDRVRDHFQKAGVADSRFVSVKDGGKMCVDHDTRYDTPAEVPGANYGIYASEDDQLVILDVDYHREGSDDISTVSMAALGALPRTLKIQSPHVPDGDRGGHRILKLGGDETPAELFERRFGTKNPVPSWGEVVSKNKYVVAPGSQLDGCSKDWCETCARSDGGYYEIKKDREIATVDPETLVEALAADPELEDVESENGVQTLDEVKDNAGASEDGEYDEFDKETVEEMLEALPGDQHFDDWIRTGYAVYDWESGATGKSVFESWSRTNPKWEDDESQRQIDYIWNNGESGSGAGRASIGTLVYLAQQNGWSPNPSPAPSPAPSPSTASSNGTPSTSWDDVREAFTFEGVEATGARRIAANALLERHKYLYLDTQDRLLKYYPEDGVFERGGERHVKKTLVRELGGEYSTHDRNEVLAMIQDATAVDVDVLNAAEDDRKLLCLQNGVLDLDERELLDHSPEFKFTRTLPVAYDPTATAERTESFLREIVETDAQKQTLEEMAGAALHPSYLKSKFLFLFGEGQNGKGLYFDLLMELLGQENVEGRGLHELADERFAKADLHEKLANIGGDIDDRKLKNVGELKRLTSGTDPVTAERKYGQPFKFVNSATLYFAANEPPAIEDQKRSMARRLVPIRMPFQFVEDPDPADPYQKPARAKPDLLGEMTTDEELSGLLNLALDGMKRLEKQGDVSLERGPMERLEHYQRFSDPIYRFATECLQKESGNSVQKEHVYQVYKEFSRVENHAVRHNSVFWREVKRVFDVEQSQPRDEQGNKAPRQLDGTGFSERALQRYAPDRISAQYTPTGGTDSEDETPEAATGPTPLANVEDAYAGAGTLSVEVTVTETFDPAPWLQAEGTVTDDSRELDFQARGDVNPLPADAVGETYRVQNVRLTTGEFDETMLEFRPDTEFVPVSPGAKASAQQSVSGAVTDGGDGDDQDGDEDAPTSAKGRVLVALRETPKDALTRGALVEAATDQFDDLGPDAASEGIDSALEQNALVQRAVDDKLEFGSAGR